MTRENSYLPEKIFDNSKSTAVLKFILWTVEELARQFLLLLEAFAHI